MTSLTETQLDKILSAINALHSGGLWQWVPAASVFVSAFLAMVVGIALEIYRNYRINKREMREKLTKEVSQLNIAISGISYNIEVLLHIVSDFIIPHHTESHIVFKRLRNAQDDPQQIQELVTAFSAPNYPALRKTCPELQFIEWDFFKETPFIVEKDPELLSAALAAHGAFEEAVACLRGGLAGGPNATRVRRYGLAGLAEALSRLGEHSAALAAAREGLQTGEETGHRQWHAELQRLEGIALLDLNRLEEGQNALEEALRVARRQQAKSYELRAATSLARLWGEQSRRGEARDLLAPVYGRFTEGFDTADLKKAQRLLDELA